MTQAVSTRLGWVANRKDPPGRVVAYRDRDSAWALRIEAIHHKARGPDRAGTDRPRHETDANDITAVRRRTDRVTSDRCEQCGRATACGA